MGRLDDLKAAADSHEHQVEQGIDKVADLVDRKTGSEHADRVDQAQDFLKDKIGEAEPSRQG